MPIVSIMRDWGSSPAAVRITSADTLADVVVTDYMLSQAANISILNKGSWEWVVGDLVAMAASDGDNIFRFDGNNFNTLIALPGGGGGGGIVLPTTPNNIAHFTDTEGTLSDEPAAIGNPGTISSGTEAGISGAFICYPGAPASSGAWVFAAQPNTNGNFIQYIQNDTVQQDCIMTVADPGNFFGQILVGATKTPFVSGNFPVASGVNGVMIDSGVSAASLSDIGKTFYVDIDILAADLAGGEFAIIIPPIPQTIRIRNLMVNFSTGMSTGDRDIQLLALQSIEMATISSSLLLSPLNTLWGGTGLNLSSSVPQNTDFDLSVFGLVAVYANGTADYNDGNINITLTYERVA